MFGVDLLLILIVVLIILLVWRGPTMLPQLGEALGKTVKSIRQSVDRDATPPPEDAGATGPPAEETTAARPDGDDPARTPGP